ncbi:MAG: hypothetical protein AAFO72_08145 [Pseudomonadota bacterium]
MAAGLEALASDGNLVVQVDTGFTHACALVQSGRVFCWGRNTFGGIANGTASSLVPVPVKQLNNVTQISVGRDHACAVRKDGRVFCWGNNSFGQLGNGVFFDNNDGMIVRVKAAPNAVQVSAGEQHTCMLMTNGRAFCWGNNLSEQLGTGKIDRNINIPTRVDTKRLFTQISAGEDITCALGRDQRAYCWGSNISNQLGVIGDIFGSVPKPTRVRNLERLTQVSAGIGILTRSCAVREDGVAFCWGFNSDGQVGDGTRERRRGPVRVKRLFDVEQITAGERHTCAKRENGILTCWGNNEDGQLGDGTTTDRLLRQRVARLSNVTHVSAGFDFTCASTQSGRAFCWGLNDFGQIGNGTASFQPNPIRQQVKRIGRP